MSTASDSLIPRKYQEVLLEKCKENNTILNLPTGSGKTYIAIMLINWFLKNNDLKYGEGGKRAIFLVNTVALVGQQGDYIKRHSTANVGQYAGYMNVDIWDKQRWWLEFTTNEVLVMTAQIFLEICLHGYIDLNCLCLMIFDECHRAVQDQPMKKIMEFLERNNVRPRILGLTATLLNSDCKLYQVEEQVQLLEATFASKIATSVGDSEVGKFSADPDIERIYYRKDELTHVASRALKVLQKCQDILMMWKLTDTPEKQSGPANSDLIVDSKKINKTLKNVIEDIKYHIEDLGIFSGFVALILNAITLVRYKRNTTTDESVQNACLYILQKFEYIRKYLENDMKLTEEVDKPFVHSSFKVKELLNLLERFNNQFLTDKDDCSCESPQQKESFKILVFVERKLTARVLYQILKQSSNVYQMKKTLKETNEKFSNIVPDFVIGFTQQQDDIETEIKCKRNKAALNRFVKGQTNVLITSDVLEEGIDIAMCNSVIKFDFPKSYRSYVQSKGRARNANGTFYILLPESNLNLQNKLKSYFDIHGVLNKVAVKRTIFEDDFYSFDTSDSNSSFNDDEEIYKTGYAEVTSSSATQLINMYCLRLPQDRFSTLTALVYQKKVGSNILCYMKLPMNSAIQEAIKGNEKSTLKQARRSVAFEAVKLLHEVKEFDDYLVPKSNEIAVEDHMFLFPLIKKEFVDKQDHQPGTNKCKRTYSRKWAEYLVNCKPKVMERAFLYPIEVIPQFFSPNESVPNRSFSNLFNQKQGFGILSSKQLPKLCKFPIYSNEGRLIVRVLSSCHTYDLSEENINICIQFNRVIFSGVNKLMKHFMVYHHDENSYVIVPTKWDNKGGSYDIDWDVMYEHKFVPDITTKTTEERSELVPSYDIYNQSVVAPWYRGLPPQQMYIVTSVCHDMDPETSFPTQEYNTYDEYFTAKYNLAIIHKNQPLLEVKTVTKNINYLRPRKMITPEMTSKRKRQELQEDFQEHLIPELCQRLCFPAVLWLKATCLPTILHRVNYLLLAEELRQKIAKDIGLGYIIPPEEFEWKTLEAEEYKDTAQQEMGSNLHNALKTVETRADQQDDLIDLDRTSWKDISLIDVFVFHDYVTKENASKRCKKSNQVNITYSFDDVLAPTTLSVPEIGCLKNNINSPGPEQYEILQALTASSSHDIMNSERLETLGDSFLKFACAYFLFHHFKNNEGFLTQFKSQIVGNSHLYNIAKHIGLGSIIKVQEFTPKSDWVAPGQCVPQVILTLLEERKIPANFLYNITVSPAEQETGNINAATMKDIKSKLESFKENTDSHTTMEGFLGIQTVRDKVMADSIEAMIGVYLKAFGIKGALQFTCWLKLLPKFWSELAFNHSVPSALLSKSVNDSHINGLLTNPGRLENVLGYKFKNRSYLLQAMSHPSNNTNRITDCYQRLEFLGDAILDFLITCHIYETCKTFAPGDLTDLRSALVNNNTFAALAVKYGMHKLCVYNSADLFSKIDTFVNFQEEHNHEVTDDLFLLLGEDETVAASFEVPKALGDLFESVAGAIFLDSGLCLQTVWNVYYRLMEKEIKKFMKNIPKHPVRMLYECCSNRVEFQKQVETSNKSLLVVPVKVTTQQEQKTYYGFGTNSKSAKCAAARVALRDLISRKLI